MRKMKKNIFVIIVTVILVVVFAVAIAMTAIYYKYDGGRVKLNEENLKSDSLGAVFYDKNGIEIDSSLYGNNMSVNIDETQPKLYNAFISIEDKRFYNHKGLDYRRIVSAAIGNIKSGKAKEGASTITQQVIKNTHLTPEKTISRKLTEMRLAKELEHKMSKREILETYLNKIYFGKNLYGVANAAKVYFNKDVNALTLAECALLAAIPKNPNKFAPYEDKINTNAIDRSHVVLRQMLEQEYITNAEYDAAILENINYIYVKKEQANAYSYIQSAMIEAADILNIKTEDIRKGNYKIYTALDIKMQNLAAQTIKSGEYMAKTVGGSSSDSAILIMNNKGSEITCYYSSDGAAADNIKRQIGSLMKPIGVYAPAIESGAYYECSVILDEKKDFGGYSPNNYMNGYYGNVSVRNALVHSLNVPAVEVYSSLDEDYLRDYSNNINMPINKCDGLARAIGGTTDGISLTDTASAYSMLARGGVYKRGAFVREIRQGDKNIFENIGGGKRVLTDGTAYIVTDMLKDVTTRGTARQLSSLGQPIAAKTGTVSFGADGQNSDIWSASYTTENTILVWQGMSSADKKSPLVHEETGGKNPTIIAKNMYSYLCGGKNIKDFTMPESVVSKKLDVYDYNELQIVSLAPENVEFSTLSGLFLRENALPDISDGYKLPSAYDLVKTEINGEKEYTLTKKARNIDYSFYVEDFFGIKHEIQPYDSGDGINIKINSAFSEFFGKKLVVECRYKNNPISEPYCLEIYI